MEVALNSNTKISKEDFKDGLRNRLSKYRLTVQDLITIDKIVREELVKEDLPASN
jgi:hypothetical protein